MGILVQLVDSEKYRRVLSNLDENLTESRQKFIDSLTLNQYKKFNTEFRKNTLELDINKITKDKLKQELFDSWRYAAYRYNLVNGTIEQKVITQTLKMVA